MRKKEPLVTTMQCNIHYNRIIYSEIVTLLLINVANTLFQQHKRRLYTWTSPDGQHQNQINYIFAAKDGEALYSQQKQDQELTVAQIMNPL